MTIFKFRALSIMLAVLFALVAPIYPAYACSIAVDDDLPTTAQEFKSAEDVVLASIQASSLTEEAYKATYEGDEILTFKVEKVYKGDRKIGETFTLTREYGGGDACLSEPFFRNLSDDNNGFYTSVDTPSLLLFLSPSFVNGSKVGYVERETDYVFRVLGYPERENDSISLNDMVVYSDTLLKHLSKVESGLSTTPVPSSEDVQRIVLMQQLITLLTQYIQLLSNR